MEDVKYLDKNKLFELTEKEEFFLKKLGVLLQPDGNFNLTMDSDGSVETLKFTGIRLEKDAYFHYKPLVCYTYRCGDDEVNIYRPTDYNDMGCREYVTFKRDDVEYTLAGGIHLEYYGPSEDCMRPYHLNEEMIKNNVQWSCMMVSHGKNYVKVYSRPNIGYGQFLKTGVIVKKDGKKRREDVYCRLSGITREAKADYERTEKCDFSEERCFELLEGSISEMCDDIPVVNDFLVSVCPLFWDSIISSLKIPLCVIDYRKENSEYRKNSHAVEYCDRELEALDYLEEKYLKNGEFIKDEGGIKR